MTTAGLLLIAFVIMKSWPETACARWLRETMVSRPLALLSRISRQHVILAVVGFALVLSFAEMGAPHLGAAMAVDVSMFVDAMITVWTVAALTRVKGSWTALCGHLPRLSRMPGARPRRRRRRRTPSLRRGANDDEGPAIFAFAA